MAVMTAIGTRIFRDKDGLVLIVPPNVDFETDLEEIKNVVSIDIHMRVDAVLSADVELHVNLSRSIVAVPLFLLTEFHPDRKPVPIKRVIYEDGEVWECSKERKEVLNGSESDSDRS